MKLCSACHQELSKDQFSNKQWQTKAKERRCKTCISGATTNDKENQGAPTKVFRYIDEEKARATLSELSNNEISCWKCLEVCLCVSVLLIYISTFFHIVRIVEKVHVGSSPTHSLLCALITHNIIGWRWREGPAIAMRLFLSGIFWLRSSLMRCGICRAKVLVDFSAAGQKV